MTFRGAFQAQQLGYCIDEWLWEGLQMAGTHCVSSVCFQMFVLLSYIQALIFPVDLHLFYNMCDCQVFFTAGLHYFMQGGSMLMKSQGKV